MCDAGITRKLFGTITIIVASDTRTLFRLRTVRPAEDVLTGNVFVAETAFSIHTLPWSDHIPSCPDLPWHFNLASFRLSSTMSLLVF